MTNKPDHDAATQYARSLNRKIITVDSDQLRNLARCYLDALEWRPIEEYTGGLVWIWSERRGRQLAEMYPSGKFLTSADGHDLKPTHFLPLPQPPKETK